MPELLVRLAMTLLPTSQAQWGRALLYLIIRGIAKYFLVTLRGVSQNFGQIWRIKSVEEYKTHRSKRAQKAPKVRQAMSVSSG